MDSTLLFHLPVSIYLLLFSTFSLQAQQPILFINPSFEDDPGFSKAPGGWRSCAFNEESPPDVHPVPNSPFRVFQKPFHGKTYVGLVVRDNLTMESIGQQLPADLQVGQCYTFSIHLCRSENLDSKSRSTGQSANYNMPVQLRIWGGISPCGKKQLLAASPVVGHLDWKKYTFLIKATEAFSWLTFEAYYLDGTQAPYNGNILLDHLSPIEPLDCSKK